MSWETLKACALLGTERQTYESVLPLRASPEAQLLGDAAALTLQRKAGRLPGARRTRKRARALPRRGAACRYL